MVNVWRSIVFGMILIALLGCGDVVSNPKEQVRVSHDAIDLALLIAYAEQMERSKDHPKRVSADYVLEHVQNLESLIAEGRAQGFFDLPEFRQAQHQFKGELMLHVLQQDLVTPLSREDISEEQVLAYFQENIAHYTTADRYALNLITLQDATLAQSISTKAMAGELDLEVLEQNLEIKVQAMPAVTLQGTPDHIREAVQSLEVGSYSPLMEREGEFLVIHLEAIKPGDVIDFEARKEYIRNDVLYAHYRQAFREAYQTLREKHAIYIDPQLRETFATSLNR